MSENILIALIVLFVYFISVLLVTLFLFMYAERKGMLERYDAMTASTGNLVISLVWPIFLFILVSALVVINIKKLFTKDAVNVSDMTRGEKRKDQSSGELRQQRKDEQLINSLHGEFIYLIMWV